MIGNKFSSIYTTSWLFQLNELKKKNVYVAKFIFTHVLMSK